VKEYGCGPIWRTISGFAWRDWGRLRIDLAQEDPAEIRTVNFPNKSWYTCDRWQLGNMIEYMTAFALSFCEYCRHKSIPLFILYVNLTTFTKSGKRARNRFPKIRSIFPSQCPECLQVKQNKIFSGEFLVSVIWEVAHGQIRRVRRMFLIWYLFWGKNRFAKYELREWTWLWCKIHFFH
jgi:hypothetical protein